VTREHKLSLIIGFVLILIVGVLVSDHMSDQRRIQLAGVAVDDERSTLGVTQGVNPVERWVRENAAQMSVAAETESVGTDKAAPVTPEGEVESASVPATETEEPAPLVIPQGRLASEDAGRLEQALASAGGVIRTTEREPVLEVPGAIEATEGAKASPVTASPAASEVDAKDVKIYRIQEKDSLFAIAKATYGDGALWQALARYNEGRVGKDGTVRVGATIKLPPRHVLTGEPATKTERVSSAEPSAQAKRTESAKGGASKPETKAKTTTHTVARGDTLSKIAERYLGSKSRAGEIMSLNKISDANQIRIGQVLKIPAK